MIEFLIEVAIQSIACFLGFLSGILYERNRPKRENQQSANNAQNTGKFSGDNVWYKQMPYQDIPDEF